ncbi:hypothetical protein [Nonomuraea sp. NPDC049400]|uniref:hypothetical protein n=1 Tax=Nonomuraea sp. NPDC049400 TaxID=3364352 RepID=UPI0037A348A2
MRQRRALATASDGPAPLAMPAWLLRATPYMFALMVRTRIRLSTDRVKRELGWVPACPSYREGLATVQSDGQFTVEYDTVRITVTPASSRA